MYKTLLILFLLFFSTATHAEELTSGRGESGLNLFTKSDGSVLIRDARGVELGRLAILISNQLDEPIKPRPGFASRKPQIVTKIGTIDIELDLIKTADGLLIDYQFIPQRQIHAWPTLEVLKVAFELRLNPGLYTTGMYGFGTHRFNLHNLRPSDELPKRYKTRTFDITPQDYSPLFVMTEWPEVFQVKRDANKDIVLNFGHTNINNENTAKIALYFGRGQFSGNAILLGEPKITYSYAFDAFSLKARGFGSWQGETISPHRNFKAGWRKNQKSYSLSGFVNHDFIFLGEKKALVPLGWGYINFRIPRIAESQRVQMDVGSTNIIKDLRVPTLPYDAPQAVRGPKTNSGLSLKAEKATALDTALKFIKTSAHKSIGSLLISAHLGEFNIKGEYDINLKAAWLLDNLIIETTKYRISSILQLLVEKNYKDNKLSTTLFENSVIDYCVARFGSSPYFNGLELQFEKKNNTAPMLPTLRLATTSKPRAMLTSFEQHASLSHGPKTLSVYAPREKEYIKLSAGSNLNASFETIRNLRPEASYMLLTPPSNTPNRLLAFGSTIAFENMFFDEQKDLDDCLGAAHFASVARLGDNLNTPFDIEGDAFNLKGSKSQNGAAWIIFETKQTSESVADLEFELKGVKRGKYVLEWWSVFQGRLLTKIIIHHATDNLYIHIPKFYGAIAGRLSPATTYQF